MPQLSFHIDHSSPAPLSLTPAILLKLRLRSQEHSGLIHTIALRCQIQIEAPKRRYSTTEQERLLELYGELNRWSQTLRPMFWTQVNTNVPAFDRETTVDLILPCSFDFNIAATKYFAALSEGEVPLCLLFSGTIFYEGIDDRLQIEQIPWNTETTYRLPIAVWRDMISAHYGNQNWLMLRTDVFDRLYEYKRRRGIPTWEQTFERLLALTEADKEPAVAASPVTQ